MIKNMLTIGSRRTRAEKAIARSRRVLREERHWERQEHRWYVDASHYSPSARPTGFGKRLSLTGAHSGRTRTTSGDWTTRLPFTDSQRDSLSDRNAPQAHIAYVRPRWDYGGAPMR